MSRKVSHVPVALQALRRGARPCLARVTLSIESTDVTTPSTIGKPPLVSTGEWRPVASTEVALAVTVVAVALGEPGEGRPAARAHARALASCLESSAARYTASSMHALGRPAGPLGPEVSGTAIHETRVRSPPAIITSLTTLQPPLLHILFRSQHSSLHPTRYRGALHMHDHLRRARQPSHRIRIAFSFMRH